MAKERPNSPLLGYNTNVRHAGMLFHIQTEDSGVGHPHVITHLFTEGTILGTKKTSYKHLLEQDGLEKGVRALMKDQHKTMFIELRDGVHDPITAKILGVQVGDALPSDYVEKPAKPDAPVTSAAESTKPASTSGSDSKELIRPVRPTATKIKVPPEEGVQVVRPAAMDKVVEVASEDEVIDADSVGRSIFDTPDEGGDFGDSLITDKSLDEVILSYLTDELDE
ncbi:MAG: hypothetical protein GY854_32310 [Deltaproteobacteria bacterium]|nr:hypothetical protein [Deltaproteobacteria bacterium]